MGELPEPAAEMAELAETFWTNLRSGAELAAAPEVVWGVPERAER